LSGVGAGAGAGAGAGDGAGAGAGATATAISIVRTFSIVTIIAKGIAVLKATSQPDLGLKNFLKYSIWEVQWTQRSLALSQIHANINHLYFLVVGTSLFEVFFDFQRLLLSCCGSTNLKLIF
jgi:hypothetical protein